MKHTRYEMATNAYFGEKHILKNSSMVERNGRKEKRYWEVTGRPEGCALILEQIPRG